MMPTATAARPRRTRYVNGIALPRVADGRSASAKRFRALVSQFAIELGGDLTAADQSLIRQAAHLTMETERLQEASVSGETVDADALIRVNSELRRVFGMLRKKGEMKTDASWLDDLEARYVDADDKAEASDAEG